MSQPQQDCKNQYTIDPSGKKKVILSIDGGGMRGAITIGMLAELEKQYEKQNGANSWENKKVFHMIAGTSTGAIIALGLAIGYKPSELKDRVYRKLLPMTFRDSKPKFWANATANGLNLFLKNTQMRDFVARVMSNGFKYAYSTKAVEKDLKQMLKEKAVQKISDLTVPDHPILMITTKDTWAGDTVFLVNAGKGKKASMDWPLGGAVTSSGAAPVFFPPVISRFVDGGVGIVNNPCLAAAIEAIEYIGGFDPALADNTDGEKAWYSAEELGIWKEFRQNLILISLGAGYSPSVLDNNRVDGNNIIDWMRYIITEGMGDASLDQVFKTRAIYGRPPTTSKDNTNESPIDFRRYNPLLTSANVEKVLGINIDKRTPPEDLGLDSYAEDAVEMMFEIGQKYAEKICWSRENTMPWDTIGGHKLPKEMAREKNIPGPDFARFPFLD
jgi:uncharacterized protein